MMMKTAFMTLAVGLAIALAMAGPSCSTTPTDTAGGNPRPESRDDESTPTDSSKNRAHAYDCDDGSYLVAGFRADSDDVYLFLPTGGIAVPRVRSASGAKYESPEAGVTFWEKNGEAMLSLPDGIEKNCVENRRASILESAKLRGVSYRGTGNEPGWSVEIDPDHIVVVTDYGQSRHEAPTPEPVIDEVDRRTTYETSSSGLDIEVSIRLQSCTDTMSGDVSPTTVEVRLGDRVLRGCGQPLH